MVYFQFELLAALAVFSIRLARREKFHIRLAAVLAVNLSFIILWTTVAGAYDFESGGSSLTLDFVTLVLFLAIFGFMSILVWFLFHVSFQEALYCAACAYLTEHIAYCIRLIVNGMTGKELSGTGSLLYFGIHILIYVVSYYLFAGNMVQDHHYATSAVRSLGLMASTLFLVVGMSIVAMIYDFEIIHGVYALFCCTFVLYSQVKQQKQLNLQEELSIQQQIWMRYKAQYEISKETIEIINTKCHDLKHQVAALKKMDSVNERKEAIESIEDSLMIYDSILKTGNIILDTVLTEKSLICKQKGISLTCIADGKLLDFMDIIDVYTMFGNALDNAVEGVSALKQDERFISLLIHEKADLVFIQIENKYEYKIKMEDGLPVTGKNDKDYHGFGIKSIIQTAEKYHGLVTIETDNSIFLLRIAIPLFQQDRKSTEGKQITTQK